MGRKGEAGIRRGPSDTQGNRRSCSSGSSLMHCNGVSAERPHASDFVRGASFKHTTGAGNGATELASLDAVMGPAPSKG
jgi:hypothetical protein